MGPVDELQSTKLAHSHPSVRTEANGSSGRTGSSPSAVLHARIRGNVSFLRKEILTGIRKLIVILLFSN